MKQLRVILTGLLLVGSASFAKSTTAKEKFQLIPATTLAEWQKTSAPETVFTYDANNAETRAKYGTIPGSKLLDKYKAYDAKAELTPKQDAKVVFFCANEKCMASHEAAKVAVKAGYKNVYVMSSGIMGWKEMGYPIAPATKN